jgi:hypothetical protein
MSILSILFTPNSHKLCSKDHSYLYSRVRVVVALALTAYELFDYDAINAAGA